MFFFFKQKTAYEMRISDWSSDVCSSDLDPGTGDVLFPVWLYRQGGGDGNRRDRTRSDFLHLLRRAVHAASSVGLRQSFERAHCQGRRRLLAGQHRLDRRRSEEHTYELQKLMRISYAVICWKKKRE